jgi:hypothetical protein
MGGGPAEPSGGTVSSVTSPHPPLYIPGEICGTVGVDPATKPDDCLAVVQQRVSAGNISAPPAVTPALLDVINQAHEHNIDLKIVVLDHNPANDTPLRDVATVVGSQHPDATVLVLSPNFVGTYSTHFPRATLEIGEDHAKTGNTVTSAQNFLQQLETPQFPWTAFTIFVLIGVLAAVVGTRFLQLRAGRPAKSTETAKPAAEGADQRP